jgi:hypothetical protein
MSQDVIGGNLSGERILINNVLDAPLDVLSVVFLAFLLRSDSPRLRPLNIGVSSTFGGF